MAIQEKYKSCQLSWRDFNHQGSEFGKSIALTPTVEEEEGEEVQCQPVLTIPIP